MSVTVGPPRSHPSRGAIDPLNHQTMLNFLRRSYPRTTLYRAFAAAPPTSAAGRNTALLAAIRQVEAAHGRGSIMQLGQSAVTVVDVIPTGSLALDAALGIGGLPRGRIVEVYGAESSGKTTVALQVVSQAQKMGLTCVYVDAEHAIDPSYAKALGINLDALYLSQPDTGEQALEIVDTMVRSGGVDVVVVDSVAALVPKAELEGEMGDSHMALQARLMSQALRKLTASLAKSHCLIIFINQIRSKVGVVFGSPDVTSGGNALKFYASIRLEIRRTGQVKGKGENEIIGNLLRVKVAKNKMAPPFRVADFEMTYGKGVSVSGEIVDLGLACGVFERSGAWFAFKCPDTVASVNAALAKGERVVVESGEEDAGGGAAAAVEVGGGKAAKGGKAKKSSAAAAAAAAAAGAAVAEESTLSSPPPTHRAPPTASAAGVESVEVGQPFAQGRDKAKAWFEARPGAMEVAAAAVKNALKKGGLGKTASAPGAIAAVGLAVSPLPGVASLEEELGPLADV